MVICLERGADLHMAQLMPLPLTVSCFCKIQVGFTFLVSAHPGSPGQKAAKRVCVCVCVSACLSVCERIFGTNVWSSPIFCTCCLWMWFIVLCLHCNTLSCLFYLLLYSVAYTLLIFLWCALCSFWYRPTLVVPDQRPLNGRCCCTYLHTCNTAHLILVLAWKIQ